MNEGFKGQKRAISSDLNSDSGVVGSGLHAVNATGSTDVTCLFIYLFGIEF